MDKKEKLKRSVLIIIIMVIACVSTIAARERRIRKTKEKEQEQIIVNGEFATDIIKLVNNKMNNSNYLISPYNINYALNMLIEGADGNTKEEIDKVIGNNKINDVSVKDKISIANAIFVKDDYKNDVKKDFQNTLTTKYQSEVLYDKFITPDVINNWVKEKTNGMIPKILDQMSKDFVLGLASALAIDVEWTNPFECNRTISEEFIKADNSKMNIEMMHQTYESRAKYINTSDATGIILPYTTNKDNVNLEFVALLPNSDVKNYVNSLTNEKINSLFDNATLATDKYHINLSLPRFNYDYEIEGFIKVLEDLGIKDAFNPDKANFKKMIEIDENIYVGEAIHKTKIELNEKGTKAAAVTYFGMYKNAAIMPEEYEQVDIKFNKPFVYMIREKNTGEILFFGSVFEPNKWEGTTCSNENDN